MMGKFDKMLEKKGKKISPVEGKAKSDVLSGLRGGFAEKAGDKLSGMKKVSVAAPSSEGLEEGLSAAQDIVEGMPEDEEGSMQSDGISPDEMAMYEQCSPEELQQKIDMLMKLKEEKIEDQSQGE